MKIALKIIGTLIIVAVAGFEFIVGIAVAASSHDISLEARENAVTEGEIAVVLGIVLIVAIWVPWKKLILKLRVSKKFNR
jgi:hypothetical protein